MRILLIFITILTCSFYYNLQPPFADKALVIDAQPVLVEKGTSFVLDTTLSTITWIGSKPSGKHTGAIKITDGTIEVKKQLIKSGSFTIDMLSISNDDGNGKSSAGLVKHLKSADFFDVENFPTASFKITGISPIDPAQKVILDSATHTISGNLLMKGVEKNISFPAIISITGKQLKARADFNLDRTLWGVNYGTINGKVANDINLKLDITANN